MADHLQAEVFPGLPRRAAARPDEAGREGPRDAARSRRATMHILVSTTVVEVGVDVPNATVMVVEHAERFGLSQLHQLRGRVGRGAMASHCVLLYQAPWTDDARERLKAMAETTDGFVIAERDLELRGPGDFFGTRQSGLPTLRIGDLVRDRDVHGAGASTRRARCVERGRARRRRSADVRRSSGWHGAVRPDRGRAEPSVRLSRCASSPDASRAAG